MKKPNADEEIIKIMTIRRYKAKYKFKTKSESKAFFDKIKLRLSQLPDFLKPKHHDR